MLKVAVVLLFVVFILCCTGCAGCSPCTNRATLLRDDVMGVSSATCGVGQQMTVDRTGEGTLVTCTCVTTPEPAP